MQYVERFLTCQPAWRKWVDGWVDRLLPRCCLVCSLDCGTGGLCGHCLADLPWNRSACRRCGIPLPGPAADICGPCLRRPPPFRCTIAPFRYGYPVRQLIRQFKFQRNLAAGRALSGLLCKHLAERPTPRPDLLVPVPMHRYRLLRRGFNQAWDIAAHAGPQLRIPWLGHHLRRTRPTPAQTGLDATQRRRNLRGAFAWRGPGLADSHVALVDDVMTTGTTVRECARVLRAAGAGRVDVWVLARATQRQQ